jgi:hypothetical protein
MTVHKISREEDKRLAVKAGIDLHKDFFVLRGSEVGDLLAIARLKGYRKSKSAPGSTARMLFRYLQLTK